MVRYLINCWCLSIGLRCGSLDGQFVKLIKNIHSHYVKNRDVIFVCFDRTKNWSIEPAFFCHMKKVKWVYLTLNLNSDYRGKLDSEYGIIDLKIFIFKWYIPFLAKQIFLASGWSLHIYFFKINSSEFVKLFLGSIRF